MRLMRSARPKARSGGYGGERRSGLLQTRGDGGFTLIELMMVVLIIALLIAIAIPTFLGARERASNRAAQTSVKLAHEAELIYYTDAQSFTDNPVLLRREELGLDWIGPGPSGGLKQVSVSFNAGEYVCLAVYNPGTNRSFGMEYMQGPGFAANWYGKDTEADAGLFCAAPPGPPGGAGTWSTDAKVGWGT